MVGGIFLHSVNFPAQMWRVAFREKKMNSLKLNSQKGQEWGRPFRHCGSMNLVCVNVEYQIQFQLWFC